MTFSWGVVHTVSPLTVIEDGSSNALPVIQSLVDPSSLTVGDMVRVELAQGGRVVVYGLPGGDSRVGITESDIADLARGQDGIPFAQAAGIATSSGSSGGSVSPVFWDNTTIVTLPTGVFTVAPAIQVGIAMGVAVAWASLTVASATSFTVRVMRINASPAAYPLHWSATQMSSGSVS